MKWNTIASIVLLIAGCVLFLWKKPYANPSDQMSGPVSFALLFGSMALLAITAA